MLITIKFPARPKLDGPCQNCGTVAHAETSKRILFHGQYLQHRLLRADCSSY
jgi:hypothetical protein